MKEQHEFRRELSIERPANSVLMVNIKRSFNNPASAQEGVFFCFKTELDSASYTDLVLCTLAYVCVPRNMLFQLITILQESDISIDDRVVKVPYF